MDAPGHDTEFRPSRNVELKARDPSPDRSLAICHRLGAVNAGILRQRDTYFRAARGRLKLREQDPGEAHLIQYDRADAPEQRESRYRIAPVDDPAPMLAALEAALGVVGVVTKRRHLFLWGAVRIHLDAVEGLGSFVEFEAVAPATSDLQLERRLVAELRTTFGVTDDQLVPSGYAQQVAGLGGRDDQRRT